MITKIKDELQKHSEQLDQPLTPENAENVVQAILNAVITAGADGFKIYLEQNETRDNTIVHNGKKYQFKQNSAKIFLRTLT